MRVEVSPAEVESLELYCFQCQRALLTIIREIAPEDIVDSANRGDFHVEHSVVGFGKKGRHQVTIFHNNPKEKESWSYET